MHRIKTTIWLTVLVMLQGASVAADVSDITNYIEYSPTFSSAGQPSPKQLKQISERGFSRVIYLAFNNNDSAIEDEDRIVKSLGMDYVHVPVDWENPTIEDFEDVAAVLNRAPQIKTLLHCQVNFRASAFSFLYRVIYAGVPIAQAKKDMDTIWQPNPVWFRFIVDVLEKHQMTHQCDGCDWGANEFEQ